MKPWEDMTEEEIKEMISLMLGGFTTNPKPEKIFLTQEDLKKTKKWLEKQDKFHCPHCGEKCIITDNK